MMDSNLGFLVQHMLRATAQRLPERIALVHEDQTLTYSEMYNFAIGLANGLRGLDLARGDRIGVYQGLSLPAAISVFGIIQAGGVYVPISSALLPNQVEHIINDSGMKGLMVDSSRLSKLAQVIENAKSLKFVVVLDSNDTSSIMWSNTYLFGDLCAGPIREPHDGVGIEKDLAAIIYTSGSTGKSKGVMLTHRNLTDAAGLMANLLDISVDDRILAVLPFNYDAGFNQLLTSVRQGSTLFLSPFVFGREVVRALLKHRITGLVGVPTLWSLLAQPSSTLCEHTYPHLRYVSCAGGRLPQSVLSILRHTLPTTKIFVRYGQTEAFLSTFMPDEELDRRPTSMGRALPNTELLVINDQGELCKAGEVGELVHRGSIIALGYWGRPELTADVFRPNPFLPEQICSDEKICYSGDLVQFDEDGFYYFVGRRDAMIKSAGYRISPTEVEEILFQSGAVRHAAVIGVPDELTGQSIKAFIVPLDHAAFDASALLDFCAERLPRYMTPKWVEALTDLPYTGNGKVDYPALRQREGL
jgi:acyl-CoA ligase (AMP-forming) (exosortase A-associated)